MSARKSYRGRTIQQTSTAIPPYLLPLRARKTHKIACKCSFTQPKPSSMPLRRFTTFVFALAGSFPSLLFALPCPVFQLDASPQIKPASPEAAPSCRNDFELPSTSAPLNYSVSAPTARIFTQQTSTGLMSIISGTDSAPSATADGGAPPRPAQAVRVNRGR